MVKRLTIYTLLFLAFGVETFAQTRVMEKLNRGLVAVEADNGVFLSWRKFAQDADSVKFNVYRNKMLVNPAPIEDVSNYFDANGTKANFYHVEVLLGDSVAEKSSPVVVWEDGYKEIPLQTPAGYSPNDASVADLDGDGELEIIVKMEGASRDNSQSGVTDPVFLQAYEFNGTMMWSINLGINIRAGAHYTQFMVYDLDGDGKAELACKTAPGTQDGTGAFLSDGNAANDDDAADYRNSGGYILSGPEYLTLFDGETGAEISTVDYVPARGNVGSWGDTYGNRVDRFLACVAYFDSLPSLVMCRGYYTRTVLAAWDYENGELVQRWVFDSTDPLNGQDGQPYSRYAGQGAHSLTVGDIDTDGKDEIVYGAMAVDHDGTGLYTTGNNHGDASHLGDLIPDIPGLEYFMPSETAYSINSVTGERIPGVYVTSAADGSIIWQKDVTSSADIGRAMVANLTEADSGCLFWAAGGLGVYDADGNNISVSGGNPSINFGAWWDGDLQRELLNSNAVTKWTPTAQFPLIQPEECTSNNGTKSTPALSGDIIGDWREEVIWRTVDNQSLRIYSTPDTTAYGFYTLLQDPQYRLALVWQNVAYNQPPHPSFYIGVEMDEPPVPSIAIAAPAVVPALQITSPSYGYELGLGQSLYVTIDALGLDDTTTVYLTNGPTLLATIDSFPYAVLLDTLGSGDYDLMAWAYDANSNVVESDIVPINVDQGLPKLTFIAPVDGAVFAINDDIPLSAEATDSNGTIDSIAFFFDNVNVATVTDSPFTTTVANPGYGVYSVQAIATDNDGKSDTSEVRSFVVGKSMIIQEDETGFCGFLTAGTVDNNNAGFTGAGFANTENTNGAGITWAITIEEAGDYQFYWRYASGNQRPAVFALNDSAIGTPLDFLDTDGSWTTWYTQSSDVVNLEAGKYEVKLTATSGNGLGNIDYLQVLAFSEVGAASLSCDSLSSTGIYDAYERHSDLVKVFPVPASSLVNIQLLEANARIQRVALFDISGKTMLRKEASSWEIQLNVSQFPTGVYLVEVETTQGLKYVKRLIVE